MSSERQSKLLVHLLRFHFAYLTLVPLLGIVSWWFLRRSAIGWMIATGFAAIAAYYALQAERYHLTTHLPSALWVVFSSPLLLVISSLLGGGFWYFYLEAAFIEVGGMCAGIIAGATVKGLKEREYFNMGVLYTFMGGFLLFWGWGVFHLHKSFAWYDNIWLVFALLNEVYIYSRMFISGELDLEYGHGRAARRAGADLLDSPFKHDDGFSLVLAFAILVVLSPFILGLLSYLSG
ncbi:MAG TPA: hypothetical protein VJT09_04875 [Pyrinomonadaceae bacterium]|nr:hypothetical protein [Pyrinomonadaceae bacterium]